MTSRLFALLALTCWTVSNVTVFAQETKPVEEDPAKLFEPREFAGKSGAQLKYRLLKPSPYHPDRKVPLVIFLHGAGERGDDNLAQLKHGMADFCKRERREQYPCYILAPQCPTGKKWSDVDWSSSKSNLPAEPSESMQLVFEVVETMIEDAPVDKNRIYITGLSMGGYGTWDALARKGRYFAAAAPICGGGDPQTVEQFKTVPIWCFHGDQDKGVPVSRSREMIEALKQAGGSPKYTEYPGVGHDSWTQTYRNPDFYAWLFAQHRSSPEAATTE